MSLMNRSLLRGWIGARQYTQVEAERRNGPGLECKVALVATGSGVQHSHRSDTSTGIFMNEQARGSGAVRRRSEKAPHQSSPRARIADRATNQSARPAPRSGCAGAVWSCSWRRPGRKNLGLHALRAVCRCRRISCLDGSLRQAGGSNVLCHRGTISAGQWGCAVTWK